MVRKRSVPFALALIVFAANGYSQTQQRPAESELWASVLVPSGFPPGSENRYSGSYGPFAVQDKARAIEDCVQEAKQEAKQRPLLSRSCTLSVTPFPSDDKNIDWNSNPLYITANYVVATAELSVNAYSIFDFPILRSTKDFVVFSRFNKWGIWMGSEVVKNKGTILEPVNGGTLRSYLTGATEDTKDLDPVAGNTLRSYVTGATGDTEAMADTNYRYHALLIDRATGETRWVVFDNANGFRKVLEIFPKGGQGVSAGTVVKYSYSQDFCQGRLPLAIQVFANGNLVKQATARSFDPDSRKYVIDVSQKPRVFELGHTE